MTGDSRTPARLDGLLAAAAKAHPSRPALVDGDRTWTYAELDAAVDDLARELELTGVRPGDRIGVFAAKSAEAVLGIHAGLRAGAVVAPLDVRGPVARTRRMREQAGFSLLLTTPSVLGAARSVAGTDDELGELGHGLGWLCCEPAPPAATATEGGYVLFTSGSTGWPKGVLLSHENVAHFATWAADEVGLKPTDRVGSQAALTFDLSTFDLFSTAAAGACAVLMPERIKAFPRDVAGWLTDNAVTVLYAVPSLYQELLERGGVRDGLPTALRALLYAGEPFSPHALEQYLKLLDGKPAYNLYGPTETNVCTFTRVPPDWTAERELTVGAAIPGDVVDVFDESGRPTDGDGEICVAGATVFQGYLEAGELRDPTRRLRFRDGIVRRAYLTGDLGSRAPGGRIRLRGRRDVQVKRRGYRIDLGELESVAAELAGIGAVAAVQKPGGEIWVYAAGSAADSDVLRHLGGHLPAYMLPDRVVRLDALPVNDRGKTDRLALAAAPPPELPTGDETRGSR
ncbi:amino acid adenylation domain-containing protein [Amycolatopsis lexingtonensis]|uniref:Amino acid adenylation domain-containing protein n=3 Tax=Amycolatopsis lexingtonensis TaxID=218822 RepID=A0ABR9IF71_9PSEU|nr:AMP-binding protein [Amycolatopsis lexingtonensis]MBE1501819.1 amino acid adenylation domain-containing protein [Amycolatopsis lexingtonensis]